MNFLYNIFMKKKKILIIDDSGFSRVCIAILEKDGYKVESIAGESRLMARLSNKIGLIIANYPFGESLFNKVKGKGIPAVILSDSVNEGLINILEDSSNSHCMIKPINYNKFRLLIKRAVDGDLIHGGYTIV